MPDVFEASPRSSVGMKVFHLVVAVIVTVALGVAAWILGDVFVWIVAGLFIMIGLAMISSLIKEIRAYAGATGSWRVEVDDTMLTWRSPVESLFRSFQLPLADIAGVQSVLKSSASTHGGALTRYFYLHLNSGKTMQLPAQEGGVWVLDVFKALEKRGVPFREDVLKNKEANAQKKGFDMLAMADWPR